MALVKGKDCSFLVYDNGGWRLLACGREFSLTTSVSALETSTTGSGFFATFEHEKATWTANVSGVCNLNKPAQLTIADVRQKQLSFTKILVNFEREDTDGNVYTDSGLAIITGVSDVENINDIATFTMDLQGTGVLTQIFTPTPLALSAVRRFEYTAIGNETNITDTDLEGKEILTFEKDGIGFSKIKTSGTPASKEVVYISGTGSFTWLIPCEPGEEIYILYQDIL